MDEQELEALVEAYYRDIYAYCFRHVGDRELAQDLTQTTFLHFWQSLGRYRHRGQLKNYLYTIAGNLCKDHYKRKHPGYLEDLPPGSRELTAPAPDTDTALAVRADAAWGAELGTVYVVANLHHPEQRDDVELRLITADPPAGARPAEPTLEDVYLYYFADEEEKPC